MNTRFKRALSSVLAFVMVMSCMIVMNVGNVYAANEPTIYYAVDATGSTARDPFGDGKLVIDSGSALDKSAISSAITAPNSLEDIAVTSTTSHGNKADVSKLTNKIRVDDSNKTYTITADEGSIVGIYYYLGNSKDDTTYADAITVDGNAAGNAVKDKINYFETVDEDGSVVFSSSNRRLSIVAISITAPESEATVTLTSDDTNGTTSVTVGGSALESGNTYATNQQVEITATPNEGYTANVLVNGVNVGALTENKHSFKLWEDTDIVVSYYKEGETNVIGAPIGKINLLEGLGTSGNASTETEVKGFQKYFDLIDANQIPIKSVSGIHTLQLQAKQVGKLEFRTTVPLKVSATFCSTGGSNDSLLAIVEKSGAKTVATGTIHGQVLTPQVLNYNLPAGTYQIVAARTDRGTNILDVSFDAPEPYIVKTPSEDKVAVYESGNDLYSISVVKEDQIADKAEISQKAGSTTINDSKSDTVYTGVSIDGNTINATDLGGDYLYAIKIAVGEAVTDTARSNVQTIVTELS